MQTIWTLGKMAGAVREAQREGEIPGEGSPLIREIWERKAYGRGGGSDSGT